MYVREELREAKEQLEESTMEISSLNGKLGKVNDTIVSIKQSIKSDMAKLVQGFRKFVVKLSWKTTSIENIPMQQLRVKLVSLAKPIFDRRKWKK